MNVEAESKMIVKEASDTLKLKKSLHFLFTYLHGNPLSFLVQTAFEEVPGNI